jgi:hypothetical protein
MEIGVTRWMESPPLLSSKLFSPIHSYLDVLLTLRSN